MNLRFSSEVRAALDGKKPLVAPETSVVAQGLPYPHNLEAARECEEAVRSSGAVPAAIAVLDGEIWVGLEVDPMRRLAEGGPDLLEPGAEGDRPRYAP